MVHNVGVGDMHVSRKHGDEIITYSLGSCVGITVIDLKNGVGGLIHCLMPLSKVNPQKAANNPCMFVDTGMMILLKKLYALGAERKNLRVKLAGGASPLEGGNLFNIGDRNVTVTRSILQKNRIAIQAEDVGGTKPRTMKLIISSGITTIKFHGTEVEL